MENGIPYILVSSASGFPVFDNLIRSQRSHDNVSSEAIAQICFITVKFFYHSSIMAALFSPLKPKIKSSLS